MFDTVMQSLWGYYGLDWAGLILGLFGCYLITNKNRYGFVASALGCACGFGVAALSSQYGYILYNLVLMGMMTRGYLSWARTAVPHAAE